MKKRVLCGCIVLCMILALLPFSVWADEDEMNGAESSVICTQAEKCEAEMHDGNCPLYADNLFEKNIKNVDIDLLSAEPEPAVYSETLVVSDSEFEDIQAALDSLADDLNGPVLIQIDKDLKSIGQNVACSVPRDKGITSLTLGTSVDSGITLGEYGDFSFYANGVPLIVDKGVKFGRGVIYGGGAEDVTGGGTSITIKEGASAYKIYGGGFNSDVTGDVSIVVRGEIYFLYGGGYACSNSENARESANVHGNIDIEVTGDQSKLQRDLVGGGYACVNVKKENVEQFLQANVEGDISVKIDCPNIGISSPEFFGGGKAELLPYKEKDKEKGGYAYWASNCTLQANVTGDIDVTLGGNARGTTTSSSDKLTLWGGGFARAHINGDQEGTFENTSISARVKGSISVDASQDYHATSGYDDWDESMVKKMYGAGQAAGRFTNATVDGSCSVKTARKAMDSEYGVFGGGCTAQGGVARVTGDTRVEICRAASQADKHENAKGVIGGGDGGFMGDATVEGNTWVKVNDDISFEGSGRGIVGGGYVSGSNGTADVLGSVTVDVGDHVFIPASPAVVGAGRVRNGSSGASGRAIVAGNVTTQMGTVTGKGYIYGAGYAGGTNSTVTVGGDVVTFIDGSVENTWVFGGGYGASSPALEAPSRVSGSVTLNVKNSSSPDCVLLGGGWGVGETPGAKSFINIENSTYKSVYGGGYQENADDIAITLSGSAVTSVYGGGNNAGARSAKVTALGDCTFTIKKGGPLTNGLTFVVGDGVARTNAKVNYVFDDLVKKVHVKDNAVLTHLLNGNNALFYNVVDLEVGQGGIVVMESTNESISGSFTGGGTIRMKAGNKLTIGGTAEGKTELRISGSPQVGQVYIQALDSSTGDFTLNAQNLMLQKSVEGGKKNWRTVSKQGIAVTVAEAENGTVSPSGMVIVAPGAEQVFTFTPNYGYKLDSLRVGDDDVTGQVSANNTYRMTATESAVLTVQFAPMKADDIHDIVSGLPGPDEVLTDEDEETILDTKLHFEALPEDVKSSVSDEKLSDLNKALSQLAEVNVEVKIDVQVDEGSVADVPDVHMLLQSMTTDEAKGLKEGRISEYKLAMTISTAGALSTEQDAVLTGSLSGKTPEKQYEVTVKKFVKTDPAADASTEILTTLQHPVTLVFDVSGAKAAAGYRRQWSVVNLHGGEKGPEAVVMQDEDSVEETVTVTSSRFSVYTLAYQDLKEESAASGGGSSTKRFTITAKAGDGGRISPSGAVSVPRGTDKTFTFTADKGYEICEVLVDGKSLGAAASYTFEKVARNHTIEVIFQEEGRDDPAYWNPFADITGDDWFYDSVKYVYEHDLMAGTSGNAFSPGINTSRGMIAMIIWKLEGAPKHRSDPKFGDVEEKVYYAAAVAWAYENGIVAGYGNGNFGPDDPITRQQLVTILYHYAEHKGYSTTARADLSGFADRDEISGYAVQTLSWACAEGMMVGKGNRRIDAGGRATRAETASILTHFCQEIAD